MQVDYFAKDFPDVKENRDEIVKLVDVEQEKYKDTLVKGQSIVKRLEIDAKAGTGTYRPRT